MIHKEVPTSQEPTVQEYLCVATIQQAHIEIDNALELVEIPDVVGDVTQIQPLLAQQKDPAKLVIWLEVFKRSVIRARPIRPFVRVAEMLPVAESRTVKLLCDCSNFTKIVSTIPTVRALYTTVTEGAQNVPKMPQKVDIKMHHALQIEECFKADVLHSYNQVALRIRAIAQREKAVESTEYIRNYTITNWSEAMEDNSVEIWDKSPNLRNRMAKAVPGKRTQLIVDGFSKLFFPKSVPIRLTQLFNALRIGNFKKHTSFEVLQIFYPSVSRLNICHSNKLAISRTNCLLCC